MMVPKFSMLSLMASAGSSQRPREIGVSESATTHADTMMPQTLRGTPAFSPAIWICIAGMTLFLDIDKRESPPSAPCRRLEKAGA